MSTWSTVNMVDSRRGVSILTLVDVDVVDVLAFCFQDADLDFVFSKICTSILCFPDVDVDVFSKMSTLMCRLCISKTLTLTWCLCFQEVNVDIDFRLSIYYVLRIIYVELFSTYNVLRTRYHTNYLELLSNTLLPRQFYVVNSCRSTWCTD